MVVTANEATKWEKWGKDVVIAFIAAAAVLASAWGSWQSTTRTLDTQREMSDKAYLSDIKKSVFTDVLQKNVSMERAIDQLVRDVDPVHLGTSPRIPNETVNSLQKARDDLGYAMQPMFIVATDSAAQATKVLDDATGMLHSAYDVNHLADANPVNRRAVQDKAGELVNTIVGEQKMVGLTADLLALMRRDLGIPEK